jgi:cytochrome c-type biogenesis protein CcmH/NrfG
MTGRPPLKIAYALFLVGIIAATIRAEEQKYPALSDEAKQVVERGMALFRNNQFEQARNEFENLTKLAPEHPVGWANLGSAEFRLGRLDESEEHLRKAVRLDPTAAQAWLTLGIISYQKNDLESGLAALAQAVYLDPSNPRAHNYLGVLIRKKGWRDGAEQELRRAIELDENYAEANFNLAILYLERQPPAIELARRHYYRALKLGAKPDPEMESVLKRPSAAASGP